MEVWLLHHMMQQPIRTLSTSLYIPQPSDSVLDSVLNSDTSILFLLPCLSKENSFSPFALYFSIVELFSIVAVLTSAFCCSNYFDLISIVWFVVSIYVSLIYCEHLISFSLIITLAGFTTQCDW